MLNSTPMAKIFDIIYPVGSIYMSTTLTTKAQVEAIFGGTWEKLEGRFLLGSSSSYANGATGGSKDAIVVSHSHPVTLASNGNVSTINVPAGEHITFGNNANRGGIMLRSADGWKDSATLAHMTTTTSDQGKIGSGNYDVYYGKIDMVINSAGSSGTDKNMPPYLVVNMFKRTALGVKHFLASIFALFSKKFIGGKAIC